MSSPVWSWPGSSVVRVVDGDTVDGLVSKTVVMDFGFGLHPSQTLAPTVRMRLNRINTPPASTDAGKAATAGLHAMVDGVVVLIETLKAYKYGGPDESPGEWMAEITLPDGTNVSDAMVAKGLGVYWDGTGPRPGG